MINQLNTKEDDVVAKHYPQFKAYMKDKYNWSPDEGVFKSVITWLIKSDLIKDLSMLESNRGRRAVKKTTN